MNAFSLRRVWQLIDRIVSRRPRRTKASLVFRQPAFLRIEQLEDRVVPAVDHLVFTTQPTQPPASITAGTGFSVTVKVETAANKVDTAFNGAVSLGDFFQTLHGSTSIAHASAGVATFSNLTLNQASSFEYIYATSPGIAGTTVSTGYSSTFGIVAAAATKIVDAGPANDVQAKATFTHTFKAVDAFGNTDPSYTGNVTIALGTNPTSATLGGTLTVAASGGVATFSDLTIDTFGTGYVLNATSGSLTAGASTPFNATGKWILTTPPPSSSVTAGSPFTIAFKDEDGTGAVDTSYTGDVTINFSGFYGTTLGGTVTVPASAGVVTWTDLTITKAYPYYLFTVSSDNVISGDTEYPNYLSVVGRTATQLAVTSQPPNPATPSSMPFYLTIQAQDQYGNPDSNFNHDITIAMGNNPTGATLSATSTTVQASSGSATFYNVALDRAGTGYTLKASSVGLSTPDVFTSAFDVKAALVATTPPPSRVTANVPFNMVIGVNISSGHPDTTFNGPVTIYLDNFSGGTTDSFHGPLTAIAQNGVATFSGLSVGDAGKYAFIVSAAGMDDLPVYFSVAGTVLKVTTQPPALVTAGAGFSLAVTAADAAGNLDTGYSGQVTLTLANNPGGATLGPSYALSAFAFNGVATFSGITLDRTGSGYTLQVAASGMTPATTNPIHALPPGVATRLVFTTSPPFSATAGAKFSKVVVKIEDGAGTVDTSYNGPVTITSTDGSPISGNKVNAVKGVATFPSLSMPKAGAHALVANAAGLQTATVSYNSTIFAGTATKLVVSAPTQVVAGGPFSITVNGLDAFGNLATNYFGSVKIALGTHPAGAVLTGTQSSYFLSSGTATINGLMLNKAGAGYKLTATSTLTTHAPSMGTSAAFSVTADKLVVTTQPGAAQAIAVPFGFAVSAENSAGTVDPTFNGTATVKLLDFNGTGATLAGTTTATFHSGVATFTGLSLDIAGSYAFSISTTGAPGATSATFGVTAVATKLTVTTQPPPNTTTGTAFGLVVAATDNSGNVDTSVTGSVTLTIANNPAAGTLGGTVTATFVNGVATFSGLSIDNAGAGYTLLATAGALTGTTNGVNVTAVGVASQLVITAQPPSVVAAGAPFGLTIKAEDSSGNVDTSYSGNVLVDLSSSGTGATLGGTVSVAVHLGVAIFTDLTLTPAGLFSLSATALGLSAATTSSIAVTPAPASQLTLLAPLGPIVAGSPFNLTVIAVNGDGIVVPNFHGDVTLALGANAAGAVLGGTLTTTAVGGYATFTGVTISKPASGLVLTASSTGPSAWSSGPLDVTGGQLVVTTQPPAAPVVGAPFNVVAKIEDGLGHVLTGFSGTVVAVLDNLDFGSAHLGGPVAVTVKNGVAMFTGLTVDGTGSYDLSLIGAGLTQTTTNAFTVVGAKATHLAVTMQPPSTVTVGSVFGTEITALDAHGNVDPSFTGNVTVVLSSGPAGGLGGTLTVKAINGVAEFSDLKLSAPGAFTLKASATGLVLATTSTIHATPAGAAAQLVATTLPPDTVNSADTFGLAITAEDSTGAIDTSFTGTVTLAIDGGATLNGTISVQAVAGVATFTGLSVLEAGGYTISATNGALVPAVMPIVVEGAAATHLVVQTLPGALVGSPFEIDVLALDAQGNLDTTFSGNVTVSLSSNPSSALLGGTLTVAAQFGVASFTDLTLDKTGAGFVVQAVSNPLTLGTSPAFDVDQDQLAVTSQPPAVVLTGAGISVTVTAKNSAGQVDTSFTGDVTLTLQAFNGSTGTLGGNTTVTAVNGVATFTGLTLDAAGSYALAADSTGALLAGSQPFVVTGALPANKAPAFTSAASAAFLLNQADSSFTITTTGFPAAVISTVTAMPAGLTLTDNGDGTATLKGTPTAAGKFTLNLVATNHVGTDAKQALVVFVNQPPTINAFTPPTFVVGQKMTFTITATPGTPTATTFSKVGTLPTGITFTSTIVNGVPTATFSGTPAAGTTGAYNITLIASNAPNSFTSQLFTLTVKQKPAITSLANVSFALNRFNTFTVSTTGSSPMTLSDGAVTLPNGIGFVDNHNGTATLSGTPTVVGKTSFTITASNGVTPNATQSFTLTVNNPPRINPFSAPTFTVGSLGALSITTTPGGATPTTLTAMGTLPAGVTFVAGTGIHAGTGTLSGTPKPGTSGTYSITLTARSATGDTTTMTFVLTVRGAPAFTSPATAAATTGKPLNLAIKTKGVPAAATLTYTGVLPGGIQFVDHHDGTASLIGTPVAGTKGIYKLIITASNGISPSAIQTLTLTVS